MVNHLLPLISYAFAGLFLLIRLFTGKKRDFIISVLFIVIGSGIGAFTLGFSSLYFFFAAILVSFIGDLLMAQWIKITDQRTVDGILAFGLAHIIYIFAFNQLNLGELSFIGDWYLVLIGIILGYVLFKVTSTGSAISKEIKFTNGIYAIIITSLLIMVLSFVITSPTPIMVKIIAGTGILLFIISDSVLAYNEFQKPINNAKEIIAITYIIAQIFLQLTPLLTFIYTG